jgi:hypothetical protein
VSAIGVYTLSVIGDYYWIKMETRRGHLGGSVKHSEGKGGESVVAILRFLCGRPRQCRLRTEGLLPMSKY